MIIKEDYFGEFWIELIEGEYHICKYKKVKAYDKDKNLYEKQVVSVNKKRNLEEAVMDIAFAMILRSDKPVWSLMDLITHFNQLKKLIS